MAATLLEEEENSGRHIKGRFLLREDTLASALSEENDDHYLSVVTEEGTVRHYLVRGRA